MSNDMAGLGFGVRDEPSVIPRLTQTVRQPHGGEK